MAKRLKNKEKQWKKATTRSYLEEIKPTSFPLKYSIEAIKRNNRLWIELYEFIELTLKFPYIFATLQQTKIVNY
jgi:hypothetical protein